MLISGIASHALGTISNAKIMLIHKLNYLIKNSIITFSKNAYGNYADYNNTTVHVQYNYACVLYLLTS